MSKVIIVISYILIGYFFFNLIRIKYKNESFRQNRIYILIVFILVLLVIWNIFRNVEQSTLFAFGLSPILVST